MTGFEILQEVEERVILVGSVPERGTIRNSLWMNWKNLRRRQEQLQLEE